MDAVAAVVFGGGKGLFGFVQHSGATVGIVRKVSDADAHRDVRVCRIAGVERMVGHLLADIFGDDGGADVVSFRQQQLEFLAAVARGDVGFAQSGLQYLTELAQQLIAERVAVDVVVTPEMIDVDVEQGIAMMMAAGPRAFDNEDLVAVTMIVKSGETVANCEFAQQAADVVDLRTARLQRTQQSAILSQQPAALSCALHHGRNQRGFVAGRDEVIVGARLYREQRVRDRQPVGDDDDLGVGGFAGQKVGGIDAVQAEVGNQYIAGLLTAGQQGLFRGGGGGDMMAAALQQGMQALAYAGVRRGYQDVDDVAACHGFTFAAAASCIFIMRSPRAPSNRKVRTRAWFAMGLFLVGIRPAVGILLRRRAVQRKVLDKEEDARGQRRARISIGEMIFDMGCGAQTREPGLQLFVDFALAESIARLVADEIGGVVVLTPLEYLHDVPAEIALEGRAHLVGVKSIHRFLKTRIELTRTGPAEVAAVGGRRRVFRLGMGELTEIRALLYLLTQRVEARLGGGIAGKFIGFEQDVAGGGLGDDMGLAAALLQKFDDVVAARAADQLADVARAQRSHRIGKEGGQLADFAPAEIAALQRLLTVGACDGGLLKIGAAAQVFQNAFGFVTRGADAFGRGRVGHGDEDLREMDFLAGIALGFLVGEEVVDVLLGDHDAVGDLALLDAADKDHLA